MILACSVQCILVRHHAMRVHARLVIQIKCNIVIVENLHAKLNVDKVMRLPVKMIQLNGLDTMHVKNSATGKFHMIYAYSYRPNVTCYRI